MQDFAILNNLGVILGPPIDSIHRKNVILATEK